MRSDRLQRHEDEHQGGRAHHEESVQGGQHDHLLSLQRTLGNAALGWVIQMKSQQISAELDTAVKDFVRPEREAAVAPAPTAGGSVSVTNSSDPNEHTELERDTDRR